MPELTAALASENHFRRLIIKLSSNADNGETRLSFGRVRVLVELSHIKLSVWVGRLGQERHLGVDFVTKQLPAIVKDLLLAVETFNPLPKHLLLYQDLPRDFKPCQPLQLLGFNVPCVHALALLFDYFVKEIYIDVNLKELGYGLVFDIVLQQLN